MIQAGIYTIAKAKAVMQLEYGRKQYIHKRVNKNLGRQRKLAVH